MAPSQKKLTSRARVFVLLVMLTCGLLILLLQGYNNIVLNHSNNAPNNGASNPFPVCKIFNTLMVVGRKMVHISYDVVACYPVHNVHRSDVAACTSGVPVKFHLPLLFLSFTAKLKTIIVKSFPILKCCLPSHWSRYWPATMCPFVPLGVISCPLCAVS